MLCVAMQHCINARVLIRLANNIIGGERAPHCQVEWVCVWLSVTVCSGNIFFLVTF